MKNNNKLQVYAALVALLLVCNSAIAEPITLRFAHSGAPDSPKGQMATRFKQLVYENFRDSSVTVEVYPGAILFDDDHLAPAVFKNRIQLTSIPISNMKPYSKRMQLFDMPFLFVTETAASRFLRGTYGKRLLRLVSRHGAVGLGYLENGMKQISSNKRIVFPDDAKNLKFLISDSAVSEKQFRRIGARPIVGNLNKVNGLLDTGVIDGQENTWSHMFTENIHKRQPFILESNHVYLADIVMASQAAWNSIPNDTRAILEELLQRAIDYGNELASRQEFNERQRIVESQTTEIVQLTVKERELWVDAMKGLWEEFVEDVGEGLVSAAASAR